MPRTVAGDGAAFAELYRHYETRVYNLCYRITGSRDDAADATQEAFLGLLARLPALRERDVELSSYVFTSARNACYDLIERRKRAEPKDELPESATPVGAGPGDPGEDPDRNVLLAAQQDEIRAANQSLPERQREVLALRELEDLSYDEIAAIMGMNRNSVAQLISRARINLRDALRGTALHSIAAVSTECERGLPLLAMRQDGQLGDGQDADWLRDHLARCDTCRLSNEAMQEAGASYRAWVPVAAAPLMFRETMARAAEVMGDDWADVAPRRRRHRRRDITVAAVLAAVLLLVVFEVELHDDSAAPATAEPASQAAPLPAAGEPKPAKKRRKQRRDPAPAVAAEEPVAVEGGQVAATEQAAPRRRERNQATARAEEALPPADEALPPTTTDPPPDPPTSEPPVTEPPPSEPPVTEPPVEDPPKPPPSDPPVRPPTTPPKKTPPRICRDSTGRPIPCPR